MTAVIGVRFRGSGKIYYFAPGDLQIRSGMHVVVETSHGMEMGTAAGGIREVHDEAVTQPLKPVIRIAEPEDEEQAARNREKEREAITICKEKIKKHDLEMKLIDAQYTLDNSKILFYFTADGRVDFRELVKDLAAIFRTRIELRQIGVRDETKILGGIGICGRPLCCSTWLTDFVPVSIRMAKEQNLSLSPSKISGVCGRLMCCLKNEEETYEYLNSMLPSVGEHVQTTTGLTGVVAGVNVLRQRVRVLLEINDEKEMQEFDASDLIFQGKRKKGHKAPQAEERSRAAETAELLEAAAFADRDGAEFERAEAEGMAEDRERADGRTGTDASSGRKGRRHSKGEGREKAERQDRSEQPEKQEESQSRQKPRKQEGKQEGGRIGKASDRGERTEKGERTDRGERPEKGERTERSRDRQPRDGEEGKNARRQKKRQERPENGARQPRETETASETAAGAEQSSDRDAQSSEGRERRRRKNRDGRRRDDRTGERPAENTAGNPVGNPEGEGNE